MNFDFNNIFRNNDNKNSSKKARQRRRGRTLRIEELENREMLDAGLMAALDDVFNACNQPLNDTVIVDQSEWQAQIQAAPVADHIAAAPQEKGAMPSKVAADKNTTSANTIGLLINKGDGISDNKFLVTVGGKETELSYRTDKGIIIASNDYVNVATHGTIRSVIITKVGGETLKAGTKYDDIKINDFTVKSAKTAKYAAIKPKADANGKLITAGEAKGNTATTVDSVTLTWVAGIRPAGEVLEVQVKDAKGGALPGFTKFTVTDDMIKYGMDKKGVVMATLKIDGLQSGTKYNVDITHVGELASTLTKATVTAKITTAKWAAPKPNAKKWEIGTGGATVEVTVPAQAKRTPGATYDDFALYVQNPADKKGRIFLGIVHADAGSTETVKKLTFSTACFANLPTDPTKGYTLFVNAVTIGDGTGSDPVANKSAEGKLAVKKGDVSKAPNGASALAALISKSADIPKCTAITADTSSVTLTWGAVPDATDYQVQYRKLGANGQWEASWATIPDIATTTATVPSLEECTQYEFQVRVGATGAWSLSAFMTTQADKLATPGNLLATKNGTTSIDLSWDVVVGAGSYLVEWNTINKWETADRGDKYGTHTVTAPATTYTIPGLDEGQVYYIRVTALPSGSNPQSDPATICYTAGGITAISDLVASNIAVGGNGFVSTITFTAPAGGTTTLYYIEGTIGEGIDTSAIPTHGDIDTAVAALKAELAKPAPNIESIGWKVATNVAGDGATQTSCPVSMDAVRGYPNMLPEQGYDWGYFKPVYFVCVTKSGDDIIESEATPKVSIPLIYDQDAYGMTPISVTNNGDGTVTLVWTQPEYGIDNNTIVLQYYDDMNSTWKNIAESDIVTKNYDNYTAKVTSDAIKFRLVWNDGDDWNWVTGTSLVAVNNLTVAQHILATNIEGENFVTNVTFTAPIGTTTLWWIDTAGLAPYGGDIALATAALKGGNTTGWTEASAGKFEYPIPPEDLYDGTPFTWLNFVCVTQGGGDTVVSTWSPLRIQRICHQTAHDQANVVTVTTVGNDLKIDWSATPHPTLYGPIQIAVPQYKDATGHWQNCEVLDTILNNGLLAGRPDTMPISVVVKAVDATEFRVFTYSSGILAPGQVPANEDEWGSVDWNLMSDRV